MSTDDPRPSVPRPHDAGPDAPYETEHDVAPGAHLAGTGREPGADPNLPVGQENAPRYGAPQYGAPTPVGQGQSSLDGGYQRAGNPQEGYAQPGQQPGHQPPYQQQGGPAYGAHQQGSYGQSGGQQGGGAGQYGSSQYGSGQYGSSQYGAAPSSGPFQFSGMKPEEARTWALLTHLAAPVLYLLSVGWAGFLAPLVMWLIFKDKDPLVRSAGAGSFNFNFALMLVSIAAWILGLITLGLLLPLTMIVLFVVFVVQIVFGIFGAMAASRGEAYKYPFEVPILK